MPTHEGLPRRSTLQTVHRTRARGYEAVSIKGQNATSSYIMPPARRIIRLFNLLIISTSNTSRNS